MGEIIVAPDPVLLARSWLLEHLDGVTVVKNRPDPVTGQVVVVRRSGGVPALFVTDSAWLSVEVFAPTDRAVSDLAHHVFGLLRAMAGEVVGGAQCYRVEILAAPADMPLVDPAESQRPRYTFTLQVTFRASAI